MNEKKIILASASQRRHELLRLIGLRFEIIPGDIDENIPQMPPEEYVKHLAHKKAENVYNKYPDACVIGADTIVVLNGDIIGKPRNHDDAFNILRRLSGNTHTVYTGVAVISDGKTQVECDSTEVTFAYISDAHIEKYIASGDPMDKAGAYGIQGPFCINIVHMSGSYFNVIGMPVSILHKMLERLGIME